MSGVFGGTTAVILSHFQVFAEAVVAAGAQVLNDFLNVLAGSAAQDKDIEEFSTNNTYLYTDDAYIDALHNDDKIALNSLIKGTSFTDEIIDFYKNINTSYDFNLQRALDIVDGSDSVHDDADYTPLAPTVSCNYTLATNNNKVLPSVTLRVNNTNLYAGEEQPGLSYGGYDSDGSDFTWHSTLVSDTAGYNTPIALNSTTLGKVQAATKDYLKCLGAPAPEGLLDSLPYNTSTGTGDAYSDVIDSAFLNFRVKWVSGLGSETGNRISNKYLYLLTKSIYDIGIPTTLTYTTNEQGNDEINLFTYTVNGDGHNYTMGLSHITTSTGNNVVTSSNPYQYDRDLISSDGYYYYDANKTLPTGDHSAQTVDDVQDYLDSFEGTDPIEVQANWLEIEENGTVITIDGVNSVFPDEIYLPGSGITLKIYDSTANEGEGGWINASDQVLRVGNLYMYKSATEILFATVPSSVYSEHSITYGKSNTTSVTYYKVFNVSAIERIIDHNGDNDNEQFRYITHKLDASNACVSAPILMGILEDLDPLEQHKLILASANLSIHLAYYLLIVPTWEQKLRAAVLNVIKIAAIIFFIWSVGQSASLYAAAEVMIIAYTTSVAVDAFIKHILIPVIISNFGEDEALIVMAIAAVAIAIYTKRSGTAGLNQFPNQAALFVQSVDIMNQMYTLAVVQPGLIEMQLEQDEWTETDKELTEEEEAFQEEYDALFGTETSPSHLLNLQIRAALNPMPASAYINYHDTLLERQFDCFDYEKYNELNVS